MTVKVYPVFIRALREGLLFGWRRSHKHLDVPCTAQEESAMMTLENEVMVALDEVINWGDKEGES